MVRVQSRSKLDELLGDESLVLLILAGGAGTKARACHALWVSGTRRAESVAVEIADLTILTQAERDAWFPDADENGTECYAVRDGLDGRIADSGPVSKLLRGDGEPSIQKLMEAFRAVDE